MNEEDEYSQSFFSDDSLNLNCVLSWRVRDENAPNPALRIDFNNSFFFDSDRTHTRPELVRKALRQLKAAAKTIQEQRL